MALPALVQASPQAKSSAGTSVSWSFTSLPSTGNYVLIVSVTFTSSAATISTPTDNQGTSYTLGVQSTAIGGVHDYRASVYYGLVKTAPSGTFTITQTAGVTSSNTEFACIAGEYSGLSQTTGTVLSTTAVNFSTAGGNTLTVTLSSLASTGVAIGGVVDNFGTTGLTLSTASPGSPWSQLFYQNNTGALYPDSLGDYRVIQSSGNVAATWSLSTGASVTGCLAFFQAAAAVTSAFVPRRLLMGYGV